MREERGEAEIVSAPEELAGLEGDWRRLAEQLGNPFLTPEWFAAARRHYPGGEPAVVIVRAPDRRVRGLLPLVRDGKQIRFAGAALADSLGPVCAPGDEAPLASAAAAAFDLRRLGATTVVLDNVEAEPPWWEALAEDAPAALSTIRLKSSALLYVEIPGSWEDYLRGRSRNFRRDIRRKVERLEREHRVEFRRTTEPDDLAADLADLYRLHDARWSGGRSRAAGDRARAVISDFAAASLERGWLRLWTLALDGTCAAGFLQWRVGARVSSYYTGFDPRLQREGVGLVLHAHTLRAAIEEGASEFNMLLGQEAWKQRFATDARPIATVVLVRPHHPLRALVSAEAGARRAVDRLGPGARGRLRSAAQPLRRVLPGARRR